MVERLRQEDYGSIPVQQMPDFQAATETYKDLLVHLKVDPESVTRNVEAVLANNKTRRSGNEFINNVNQVSKRILPTRS